MRLGAGAAGEDRLGGVREACNASITSTGAVHRCIAPHTAIHAITDRLSWPDSRGCAKAFAPSNSVLCCSAAESLDGSVGEISGFSRVNAGSKLEKSVVPPEIVYR